MVIRSATTADVTGLYQLALDYDRLGTATTAPWDAYAARMSWIIEESAWLVLGAVEPAGDLVGYALAQDYGSNPRRKFTVGRLHDLFVRESHRRLGVARQLMAGVVDWCRPRGMILDWQSRLDAVPFYESLGLVKDTVGDQSRYPAFSIDMRYPTEVGGGPA